MTSYIQIIFFDFKTKISYFKFEDNFGFIGDGIVDERQTLDEIAEYLGLKTISSFIGEYIIEDEYEFGTKGDWYPVKEALETVNGLLGYLQGSHRTAKRKSTARKARKIDDYIIHDLELLRDVLKRAIEISESAEFKFSLCKTSNSVPVIAMSPKIRYPY
jgi:hypothetical protein